jgi:hypothetical protein
MSVTARAVRDGWFERCLLTNTDLNGTFTKMLTARIPHLHLGVTANRVMLETEHLVEAAVDALHRSTPVVGFLPFVRVSGNRREDAAVQLEWDTHHAAEFAHADGRELFTFGPPGAFKAKGCGGAAILERQPVLFEADKGERAQLVLTLTLRRTGAVEIKRWSRAKKNALIAGDFGLLRLLAGRSKLSRAVRDAST